MTRADWRLPRSALTDQVRGALAACQVIAPGSALVGSVLHSQIFGGMYGPRAAAHCVQVAVSADGHSVDWVLRALRQYLPARWVAGGARSEPSVNVDRVQLFPHPDGSAVLRGSATDLDDAVAGRVALNPAAPAEPARRRALDLVQQFPGLSVEDSSEPVAVRFAESAIPAAVAHGERGGRRRPRIIAESELPWLDMIRRWHQINPYSVHWVPTPVPAHLPTGDPWSACDSEFREWLISQTCAEYEPAAAIQYDDALLRIIGAQSSHDQKPTHQGWSVGRHAVAAAVALDTSRVHAVDRRAVRVATLLHDVGKGHGVHWIRGAHARVGARMWMEHRPSWLTDEEAGLVTYLIQNHDLLGFLDRGLMNSSYPAGLSPCDVREVISQRKQDPHYTLRLISAVYAADIASVPTLRYFSSLTPLLERIVEPDGIFS